MGHAGRALPRSLRRTARSAAPRFPHRLADISEQQLRLRQAALFAILALVPPASGSSARAYRLPTQR
jgi:hypothetical protein